MKAVVYHADGPVAKKFQPGLYKSLVEGLQRNLDGFGIPLIHMTTRGHPIWAREGREYDGNPDDTVWNRDKFFIEFLKTEPDDVYMLLEPDHRVMTDIPPLVGDVAVLYRGNSGPHYTPSWRMARNKAAPFFEWILTMFPTDGTKLDWDGDSTAWGFAWERLGRRADLRPFVFIGLNVEVRDYNDYTRTDSKIIRQWKSTAKCELAKSEMANAD